MKREKKIPRVGDLERVLVDEGTIDERLIWRWEGTKVRHHPTQPAVQYKDGDWVWYWMDQRNRWDGPATNWKGENQYWIMGDWLSREEWERDPRRLEWLKNQIEGI